MVDYYDDEEFDKSDVEMEIACEEARLETLKRKHASKEKLLNCMLRLEFLYNSLHDTELCRETAGGWL